MNFNEALKIIKESKITSGKLEREQGSYLVQEEINVLLYADLLNIYQNIEKSQKLITAYGKAAYANVKQQREAKIAEIKEKTQEEKVETKTEKPEYGKEQKKEQKEEAKVAEKIERMEKIETDNLKKEMPFKKDNMKDNMKEKPGLGLSIPKKEQALEEANKRVETLKTSYEGLSKSQLSAKLIQLTTELLKEKQEQKRVVIKAEIEKIKALIEGKGKEDNEKQIETMLKNDIEKAVNTIKAAANEQKQHMSEQELYEAIKAAANEYKDYLKTMHNAIIEMIKVPLKEPDYSSIDNLVNEYKPKEKEEKKEVKEEIVAMPIEETKEKKEIISEEVKQEQIVEEKKTKREEIMEKINAMKEAQLLHELGAKDRKVFYSYLRGEISKQDAIKRAKQLIAIEMGMNEQEAKEAFS
ncbi:MAG: hypothetical protein QXP22_02170 [Candidatus Anstonellales archaeon]